MQFVLDCWDVCRGGHLGDQASPSVYILCQICSFGFSLFDFVLLRFIADNANYAIRKLDASTGLVSTFAGTMGTYSPFSDGTYASATFNTPTDLVVDPSGQIYVTDWGNAAIRLLSGGNVSTLAGGGTPGLANGPSSTAQFNRPQVRL